MALRPIIVDAHNEFGRAPAGRFGPSGLVRRVSNDSCRSARYGTSNFGRHERRRLHVGHRPTPIRFAVFDAGPSAQSERLLSNTGSHRENGSQTDEELAARIGQRDGSRPAGREALAAFERLYDRHAHRLLGYLASRVRRNDLDDLHQSVWQKVWEHVGDKFQGGNFRAWLHQIARNLLVDESRRRRAVAMPDHALPEAVDAPDPVAGLLDSERKEVFERCLDGLRDDLSELVRARLGGESYDVICTRAEITPARAHKLFHRAKEQLSDCFARSYE